MLDASGTRHLLLAETLGLAMARRAADILERHRAALASGGTGGGGTAPEDDDDQFALDNAIFTAVLDAASECLGRFDTRAADDRWCDALLQVIYLAQLATLTQLPVLAGLVCAFERFHPGPFAQSSGFARGQGGT
jgi:hypothetical protein